MLTLMMCRPEHFKVAYEINPFMHVEVEVDHDRAVDEWENLRETLEACGAHIVAMDPVPGLPDLVFTANAGFVQGDIAVPSRFLHPERKGEEPHDRRWFEDHDLVVLELPESGAFEGAGDVMKAGTVNGLLAGYRFRSSIESHVALGRLLGKRVASVALADARFYHLDLALLPLDERRALAVGAAFDRHSATVVKAAIPQVEELSLDEGVAFAANSVVVDGRVVMHACPPRVGRILKSWGYDAIEAPVGEFLKAGGSCRCLTLDVGDHHA